MRRPVCAIYAVDREQRARAERTRRAFVRAGWGVLDVSAGPLANATQQLGTGPLWLVRAGCWPRWLHAESPAGPAPSQTGAALCALGAVCSPPGAPAQRDAAAWSEIQRRTGGDLSRVLRQGEPLPPAASVLLDERLTPPVLQRLARGEALEQALLAELRAQGARVVRHSPLDVYDDPGLRVAQVVTSVQQGGAERVALDLAAELPQLGIRTRVFALYPARRAQLAAPSDTLTLEPQRDQPALLELLARELAAWGTDLAHVHLLDAGQLEALAEAGYRAVVTLHNTAVSWPAGFSQLGPDSAALLVGCSHAVEAELAALLPALPRRCIWNGIRPAAPSGERWRERFGVPPAALLLLALANPRPQKRLQLLPAIAAAAQAALGETRAVHVLIAGSTSTHWGPAATALRALQHEIERHALGARVHFAGSVEDVAGLLAAADVLVSPSAHEGLSLAHLEALAAARPVVASGAGGTAELAALTPALTHLPLDSTPERFAQAVLTAAQHGAADGPELIRERFAAARMARSYARLYPRAVARSRPRAREGVWLITNNFSTGGAQSSARKLLLAFQQRGVRARAAVIEEQPDHPTLGRRALQAAGIEVLAVPPPSELPAPRAVARLLDAIEQDPPQAILLWNVIAEHKLLLGEGLLDLPLIDVSPGEMYFSSLERYFRSARGELPFRTPRDYGARLSAVAVKFAGEREQARQVLGAPVHVIPNGVPLGPRPTARPARGLLQIGSVARIHPHKRLGDLLAALRLAAPRLPPHVLRIAGGVDGSSEPHAAELRQLARGLNVEWLGELGDPRAFLGELDLFALVAEPAGCPNASLEAMAQGLPIIATAVGGMPEQLGSRSGLLVPARDPAAFAEALVELAHAPERRARLGRAAWERARRLFSMQGMVERYGQLCGVFPAPPATGYPDRGREDYHTAAARCEP